MNNGRSPRRSALIAVAVWATGCGLGPRGPSPSDVRGDDASVSVEGGGMALLYSPGLGRGVNFAETETFRRCVTVPREPTRRTLSAALYSEKRVQSSSELHAAMEVNAAVSAKGLWGNAGGKASFFQDVRFDENSLYWLVNADYTLVNETIDLGDPAFGLTDAARSIVQNQGLDAFYRACGTHFYSGHQRGSHYALLYEFYGRESHTMEKLRASAEYGGWGIKAKADFSRVLELADRASMLRIHTAIVGGSADISSYATTPEHLESELKSLRHHLTDGDGGVALNWAMESYDIFPEVAQAQASSRAEDGLNRFLEHHREVMLAEVFRNHASKSDEIKTLEGLLGRCSGPEPACVLSHDQRQNIHSHLNDLRADLDTLAARGKRCIIGSHIETDCALTDPKTRSAMQRSKLEETATTPIQDASDFGDWRLFFVMDSINRTTSLVGRHTSGAFQAFGRHHPFSIFGNTVHVHPKTIEGFYGTIVIGTPNMIQHPKRGHLTPDLCLYNYADTCNLRLIQIREGEDDVSPLVKLQLILFDSYGFPIEKQTFEPT